MAQVSMDSSEYELMKENKRLLEESLENERILRVENEKLKEEKIQALESAKMKISKITKIEKSEHLMVLRDKIAIAELARMLGMDPIIAYERFGTQAILGTDISSMLNPFFDKITNNHPEYTEVETMGLDEVKGEIRAEMQKSLDTDTREKLEKLKTLEADQYRLLEDLNRCREDSLASKIENGKLENKLRIANTTMEAMVDKNKRADFVAKQMNKVLSTYEVIDYKGFGGKKRQLNRIFYCARYAMDEYKDNTGV